MKRGAAVSQTVANASPSAIPGTGITSASALLVGIGHDLPVALPNLGEVRTEWLFCKIINSIRFLAGGSLVGPFGSTCACTGPIRYD